MQELTFLPLLSFVKIKLNFAAVSERSIFELLLPAQGGMLPKNLCLKAVTELQNEPVTAQLFNWRVEMNGNCEVFWRDVCLCFGCLNIKFEQNLLLSIDNAGKS